MGLFLVRTSRRLRCQFRMFRTVSVPPVGQRKREGMCPSGYLFYLEQAAGKWNVDRVRVTVEELNYGVPYAGIDEGHCPLCLFLNQESPHTPNIIITLKNPMRDAALAAFLITDTLKMPIYRLLDHGDVTFESKPKLALRLATVHIKMTPAAKK